jgi:hypothetical protein
MRASQITFDAMQRVACANHKLGVAASYIQVEYGINELQACWDGFVDTSDYHDLEFKSRKQVCEEFANALSDYIDYLGESIPLQMGS